MLFKHRRGYLRPKNTNCHILFPSLSLGFLQRYRGGAGLEQRPRQQRPRVLTSWCLRGFGVSTTTVSGPLTSRLQSNACVPIGWQCKNKRINIRAVYPKSKQTLYSSIRNPSVP